MQQNNHHQTNSKIIAAFYSINSKIYLYYIHYDASSVMVWFLNRNGTFHVHSYIFFLIKNWYKNHLASLLFDARDLAKLIDIIYINITSLIEVICGTRI
jgi:hypothetical protein